MDDVKIVQIAYSSLPLLLDHEGNIWVVLIQRMTVCIIEFNPYGPINLGCRMKAISDFSAVGFDSSWWEISFGGIVADISVNFEFCEIFRKSAVKLAACGRDFSIVICDDDSVWCQGNNDYGQLGLSDTDYKKSFTKMETNEKFISVSCGSYHSLLLNSDHQVFFCGNNKHLRLNLKSNDTFVPFRIEQLNEISLITCQNKKSLCVDIHGDLFIFGQKRVCTFENPIWKPKLPPIVVISSGLATETIVIDENDGKWILRNDSSEFEKLDFPALYEEEDTITEIENFVEYVSSLFFII